MSGKLLKYDSSVYNMASTAAVRAITRSTMFDLTPLRHRCCFRRQQHPVNACTRITMMIQPLDMRRHIMMGSVPITFVKVRNWFSASCVQFVAPLIVVQFFHSPVIRRRMITCNWRSPPRSWRPVISTGDGELGKNHVEFFT